MKLQLPAIRKVILNQSADTYLFLILFSFAGSVAVTRLFLGLTGYPQLGSGPLHVAHVLWGGLLLFIAILLLMIYANRWIYPIAAIISGVGIGLFIDEVGKFITSNNDYFFPSAAPIIYAIFLLTVFVFLLVRKSRDINTQRNNLYYVLQDLQEVADHDLSEIEKTRIQDRLQSIIAQDPESNLAELSRGILKFIEHERLYLAPHKPTRIEKIKNTIQYLDRRWLTQSFLRKFLLTGLGLWGGFLLIAPTLILILSNTPEQLGNIFLSISRDELLRNYSGLNWFEARIGLESAIGLLLCFSTLLWLFKKEHLAAIISTTVLMLSLTVVNLIVFYFDQFSAIFTSLFQLALLIGVWRYQQKFLSPSNILPEKPTPTALS